MILFQVQKLYSGELDRQMIMNDKNLEGGTYGTKQSDRPGICLVQLR
jgi:hypothetical protein